MRIFLEIKIEYDENLFLEKKWGKFIKLLNSLPVIGDKIKKIVRQEINNQISNALEKELDAYVEINEIYEN